MNIGKHGIIIPESRLHVTVYIHQAHSLCYVSPKFGNHHGHTEYVLLVIIDHHKFIGRSRQYIGSVKYGALAIQHLRGSGGQSIVPGKTLKLLKCGGRNNCKSVNTLGGVIITDTLYYISAAVQHVP